MSTVAVPESLVPLVDFLNGLETRVPIEELRQQLLDLKVTVEDLRTFIRFNDCSYSRNLICEGQWYELLCICWKDGQESLIHDHSQSTCGLRVIKGAGVETTFQLLENGKVQPASHCQLNENDVCCTQDDDIHQVCNNITGHELVTLHIYSPPLGNMRIWRKDH